MELQPGAAYFVQAPRFCGNINKNSNMLRITGQTRWRFMDRDLTNETELPLSGTSLPFPSQSLLVFVTSASSCPR